MLLTNTPVETVAYGPTWTFKSVLHLDFGNC